jgi:hypothetical protein
VVATVAGLLTRKVSYQENAWSVPCDERSVQQVLSDIRDGRYAAQVQHLRDLLSRGDRDRYAVDKKRLPGVTFSATFNRRRQIAELKVYTELLVLDVDHLSKHDLAAAIAAFRDDVHVLACWMSPSQEGLKGLVGLSRPEGCADFEVVARHRAAFAQVSSYFERTHSVSLDQSGSDVTRLCFLSSDRHLHLRNDAVQFVVEDVPEAMRPKGARPATRHHENVSVVPEKNPRHSLNRTEGKNLPSDRASIGSIIKYLTKRQISITANYDRWVRVALAIADTFTYDVGKKYFLDLCRLDGNAHDEDGSIRLLESCYYNSRGKMTLGTIRHYAQEHGYKKVL